MENQRKLFWTRLLEKAKEKDADFQNLSPVYYHWIGKGSGKYGIRFILSVLNDKTNISVSIDGGNKEQNKEWFDELGKHKEELEKRFGEKLEWYRLDSKRASGIGKDYFGYGLKHKETWDEIQEKMVKDMMKLEDVFKEYIGRLK